MGGETYTHLGLEKGQQAAVRVELLQNVLDLQHASRQVEFRVRQFVHPALEMVHHLWQ